MKNGPPMTAVITPTGTSAGASATRAPCRRSKEQGPDQERGRQQQSVIRAKGQSEGVRNDQSHKSDRSGQRSDYTREQRSNDVARDEHPPCVDSAGSRPLIADRDRFQSLAVEATVYAESERCKQSAKRAIARTRIRRRPSTTG